MPIITKNLGTIETPNNPQDAVTSGVLDLSMLLSEHYGKNIRQGNGFTVTGVQAYLRPHNDSALDDYDVGGSALVQCQYVPTTGHSKKAWNQAFTLWKKHRSRFTTMGIHPVRNEDLEFCWAYSLRDTNRTSRLYQHQADGTQEWMTLTGDSTVGEDWCLQDFYNTSNPAPQRTADHFTGQLYKADKYGSTKFPKVQYFAVSGSASSFANTDGDLSGGMFTTDWEMFPSPINILCGLIKYDAYLIPGDTTGQIEDNVELIISLSVKKWKPLVIRPKKKKMKKFVRRKSSGRRFSRKRSRR